MLENILKQRQGDLHFQQEGKDTRTLSSHNNEKSYCYAVLFPEIIDSSFRRLLHNSTSLSPAVIRYDTHCSSLVLSFWPMTSNRNKCVIPLLCFHPDRGSLKSVIHYQVRDMGQRGCSLSCALTLSW